MPSGHGLECRGAVAGLSSAEMSTAGESASALGVRRCVVEFVVVVERRLVGLRELLPVLFDVRRRLDLLLGDRYLQVIGTDRDPAQRDKGQVAANEALLDGGELRLIVLDVDVDVLQLADPLAITINEHLAVPLADVPTGTLLVFGHRRSLLISSRCLAVIHLRTGLYGGGGASGRDSTSNSVYFLAPWLSGSAARHCGPA